MKLRIRGNTIRLRLTRSEVDEFVASGRFADKISFGAKLRNSLVYTIEKTDADVVSAAFDRGRLTVFVPAKIADELVKTDQVGFEAVQQIDRGNELHILIEKDFACLSPQKSEDTDDNFPHPKTSC